MNDVIDFLFFHFAQKSRVDTIVPGPDMGVADDGEGCLMLCFSIERNENESEDDNEYRDLASFIAEPMCHGHYYTPPGR